MMKPSRVDEFPMLTGIEIHGGAGQNRNGRNPSRRLDGHNRSRRLDNRKRVNSKRVAPDVGHEHLLKSGALGRCHDPLCTTCPAYFNPGSSSANFRRIPESAWSDFLNLCKSVPRGVINPHTRFIRKWNKCFLISCLVGIFLDPLFFFLLSVKEDAKCIIIDENSSTALIVLRSVTDTIYFIHILLQFRLAYVTPFPDREESDRQTKSEAEFGKQQWQSWQRPAQAQPHGPFESLPEVSASTNIVDDPKKIARNYLKGWFIFDLIAVVPLPQIMIRLVLPRYLGAAAGANYAKNVLRVALLLQAVPRIVRIIPVLTGHASTGFTFETAWANFVLNLLLYILCGHVIGSCWYLFGLQRVNQCLHNACANATVAFCNRTFIDCGNGHHIVNTSLRKAWTSNSNATNCLANPSYVFTYGIYQSAVQVTTQSSSFNRYIYSIFWGFQQISTLAGNQIPSLFVGEVLFVMTVIGLGLLLLTLLIGNMQNFLQYLGRRSLEMQLRRYEVEKWMTRRHLPLDLRKRVRQFERFNWAATKGVEEENILQDLPEDLYRDIRRTFFTELVSKVRVLEVMDDQVLDAIYQKLRQKLYIKDCKIATWGGPMERMLFIMHGKLHCQYEDGEAEELSGNDIVGQELLTWCVEHATNQQTRDRRARLWNRNTGKRPVSLRTVYCKTNVEAFVLEAQHLEEIVRDFQHLIANEKLRRIIRYESYWTRVWAITTIQVYWRYRQRRKLRNLLQQYITASSR